jgi:hypothetical protein
MIINPQVNVGPQLNLNLGLNLAVLSPSAQQAINQAQTNNADLTNALVVVDSLLVSI